MAFLALPYFVMGISVRGVSTALILALLWGFINVTIKPILLVLTLPINLLTFGIFTFIVNGFLLWLLGGVIKGFEVHGFFSAVVGAMGLSAIGVITHWAMHRAEL